MENPHKVNRNYKDRLFRFIFNDKTKLLSLYNAINETGYTNPEDLEINTLEDVIYLGMKNDLSFLICGVLNLYEHQSSWNPNMAIRNLIYIVDLYKGYIKKNRLDLFGSKKILLPTPQAIVFYNGQTEEPERQLLKLSDSFEVPVKEHCLEFSTLVLNINYGHNKALMEKCKPLMDYSIFVSRIRTHRNHNPEMAMEEAVNRTVEECIKDGILADILSQHKSEVTNLILKEYDEQWHIDNEKKWSREEGIKIGTKEGIEIGTREGIEIGTREGIEIGSYKRLIQQVCKKLLRGKSPEEIADNLEEDFSLIQTICSIASQCAPDYDCDWIYNQLIEKGALSRLR